MRTYNDVINTPGDIWKHLPVLKKYAEDCLTIMEIGLGQGNATIAFLEAKPNILRTIEIDPENYSPGVAPEVEEIAKHYGVDYRIIVGDSRSDDTANKALGKVDFLFIDGDHSHLTVKRELELYGNRANKYIGFHDVVTFGYRDMNIVPENPSEHGINWPIERFLQNHPEWQIDYISLFNNGLLILKKNG